VAVVLRLRRVGAKKLAIYRIVATDSRSPREGRFLETLGTYNPGIAEDNVKIDKEKVELWLNRGAQVSDTVRSLLKKQGVRVSH